MRALPVLLLIGLMACTPRAQDDRSQPNPSSSPPSTLLDRYDFSKRTARFDLPGRLDEVSGLAFTPDGRLFGHDDERGRVHEIDPETGVVGKRFDVGEDMVRADFEGIAIAGDRFFLISSRGLLYEFREGRDREAVPYRMTDTGVGADCDAEGLDYDEVEDALLIACKASTPDRGVIVIHRLPLDPERARLPPLTISKEQLGAHGLGEDFDPSAIAVDPTGTLVLLSGRHEAIIEVDRAGRILAGFALSDDRHPQPEGLEFGPDGTLYIADEKNRRDARMTVYARLPAGPPAGPPTGPPAGAPADGSRPR